MTKSPIGVGGSSLVAITDAVRNHGRVEAPRVSAVLVNFRTARHVGPCLEAFVRAAGELPVEIVLVDSDSPDREAARAALEKFVHTHSGTAARVSVAVVALPGNRGFGAAANAGAARARAATVLFLNPDARPEPGTLVPLVNALESLAAAGAVAPRLVDARGRVQTGDAGPLPSALGAWRYALGSTRGLFAPRELGPHPERVGWLSGAFLLVGADALRAVGGFDESFFLFGEDVDLGRRLASAGFASWLVPEVRVVHEGGVSYKRAARRGRKPSPLEGRWALGLCRAHAKGRGSWERTSFALALFVGLIGRAAGHALGLLPEVGLEAREGRARANALFRAARALGRQALSVEIP